MTTTVKITAHTSEDLEVNVQLTENGALVETLTLQNGESAERYVYGGRVITVNEIEKAGAQS